MIRTLLAVTAKELLVEWRERTRVASLLFFGFAVLLMVAFAQPSLDQLADVAPGALWLGLLLASTRSLDQSFRVELENGALEGMALWPVAPALVFLGKALANTIVLALVATILLPLTMLLYHPPFRGSPAELALVVALGCSAVAAPGTLLAALTAQARGSSALLPLMLFPLVLPAVLAAIQSTRLVFEGDPMGDADTWFQLLLAFNAAHWSLDALLFSRILDEG